MAKTIKKILKGFHPRHGEEGNKMFTDHRGYEIMNIYMSCESCVFNYGPGCCIKLYEDGVTDRATRIKNESEVDRWKNCRWFTMAFGEPEIRQEVDKVAKRMSFPPKKERDVGRHDHLTPKKKFFLPNLVIFVLLALAYWLWSIS